MIDFYMAPTPNGQKPAIMLEETGLAYETHPIDIGSGAQKQADYLAINPNGKIPAIIDRDGFGQGPVTVFESGAILIYLAEKSARFLPAEPTARIAALQWLMFQMAGVGPMFGQASYWHSAAEKVPAASERYTGEARRLLGVLDRRLGEAEYLAGTEYSIADIATWTWVAALGRIGLDTSDYGSVRRWHAAIGERPAVQRGMAVGRKPG